MRVLIADKLSPVAVEALTASGLNYQSGSVPQGWGSLTAMSSFSPDVLVVRSTKVKKEHFDAAAGLQLIVRAGAGVNTIDLTGASARAITVSNCPGMNAVAVAELTFGHILNTDRRIADNVRDLRAGEWRKKHYSKAQGLKGQTIGVIGCGSIGLAVIKRAHAFEMNVVAYSPSSMRLKPNLSVFASLRRPSNVPVCAAYSRSTPLSMRQRVVS